MKTLLLFTLSLLPLGAQEISINYARVYPVQVLVLAPLFGNQAPESTMVWVSTKYEGPESVANFKITLTCGNETQVQVVPVALTGRTFLFFRNVPKSGAVQVSVEALGPSVAKAQTTIE